MLLIHPVIQFLTTLLALYVFFTGIQRFRFLHLNQKAAFSWRRHVAVGISVIVLWVAGFIGGLMIVKQYWYTYFITGIHSKTALLMLPLMAFGLGTGLYMNRIRKKRKLLPLLHGINNLILLLLTFSQVISGWQVYQVFVLGNG